MHKMRLECIEDVFLKVHQISKVTYHHHQTKLTVGFYNQKYEDEGNDLPLLTNLYNDTYTHNSQQP